MSNQLHSKQKKSILASLIKECEKIYERHPGAYRDSDLSKQLAAAEDELYKGLDEAKNLILMRRVGQKFLARFREICREGAKV